MTTPHRFTPWVRRMLSVRWQGSRERLMWIRTLGMVQRQRGPISNKRMPSAARMRLGCRQRLSKMRGLAAKAQRRRPVRYLKAIERRDRA